MRKLGGMKNTDTVRVGIYIRPDLRDRIDSFAVKTGLTRSSAIAFLCSSYLDRMALNEAVVAMAGYVDSGVTTESEALSNLLDAVKKAVE